VGVVMDKIKKGSFNLAVEVKLHCLAMMCVNNIQHTCNLKGVAVDESGVCAGLVKFKPIKKKKNDDD
jgi:hypothetical protein